MVDPYRPPQTEMVSKPVVDSVEVSSFARAVATTEVFLGGVAMLGFVGVMAMRLLDPVRGDGFPVVIQVLMLVFAVSLIWMGRRLKTGDSRPQWLWIPLLIAREVVPRIFL